MFYIIRSYRQSWLLLIPAIVAAVFVSYKENVDDWPDFLDESIATVMGAATGLLGFILSLNDSNQIPIRYIGLGEKISDISEFEPFELAKSFVGHIEL